MKIFFGALFLFFVSLGAVNAQTGSKPADTYVFENDVDDVFDQIRNVCNEGVNSENLDLLIGKDGLLETALSNVENIKQLMIIEEAITDIYSSGVVLSSDQASRLNELNSRSSNKQRVYRGGGDASLKFETAINRIEVYLGRKSYSVEPTANALIDVLVEKEGPLERRDFVAMDAMVTILKSSYCPYVTAEKYVGFVNIMDRLMTEVRLEPTTKLVLPVEIKKELAKIRYESANPRR